MKAATRKRLEAAGWRVGAVRNFLGLSAEEEQLIEMKLALSDSLRRHRLKRGLTQKEPARRLGSSQSRVAKLEAGAPGASLDLVFRALFATGVTVAEVARELAPKRRPAA